MTASRRYTQTLITVMVLSYTAAAGLWILLSDQLLAEFIHEASPMAILSMLKGWFFVLVTSLLFYLALRKVARLGDRSRKESLCDELTFSQTGRSSRLPLLLLSAGILALTAYAIFYTFDHHRRMQVETLQTLARLKAQQVGNWMDERQRDAQFIHSSSFFAERYRRWQAGDAQAGQQLQQRLEWFIREKGFSGITLLDDHLNPRWHGGNSPPQLAPALQEALSQARQQNRVRVFGPYIGLHGTPRIDFIAPCIEGMVVLHADPKRYLYPLLQDWPIPTRSGDTVLARRDGAEVVFLNSLRHRANAAGELRLPLATPSLLMAQVLRGEVPPGEVFSGEDYRGVSSLGVAQPVSDSDWFLLAKLDWSELHQEALQDSVWIGFAGLLSTLLALIGLRLLRQHEELAHSIALGQSRQEKLQALELLHAIAESSDDAIFAIDQEGRFILFNKAAAAVVGKPASQVLGQTHHAIFPPEQAQKLEEISQEILRSGQTKRYEEWLDTAQGRRSFLTSKGPLLDKLGHIYGLFGIARDITERKANEEELQKRFNELERFTQASIGRELHMIELKKEVNRLSQELGREPPYPLAFLKEADKGMPG